MQGGFGGRARSVPLGLTAVFLGLAVVTWAASWFVTTPRGSAFDIDYALALLATAFARRFGQRMAFGVAAVGLTSALAIDALAFTSQPIFDGVMRISDFVQFIDLWPWRALAPGILFILALGLSSAYFAARSKASGAGLLLALVLSIQAGDLVLKVAPPAARPFDLITSSARTLIRSHVSMTPSGLRQRLVPFPGATTATSLAAPLPPHILSVGMESLGVYPDPRDQARLLDNLFDQVGERYRVKVNGVHSFRGLTLQGEVRELCGLRMTGTPRSADDLAGLANCLPHRLARAGYLTIGYHANWARFYHRRTVYPGMGFRRTVFQEQMSALPRCRPEVFDGACDRAVFDMALGDFVEARPVFVHVMTLNGHRPYPTKVTASCADLSPLGRETCAYDRVQGDSLRDLGQALATTASPPDLVVVFGDHGPIFGGKPGSDFTKGVAPYIELELRHPLEN